MACGARSQRSRESDRNPTLAEGLPQGTGAGARSNGARPIREQRMRLDPSTKPKPNSERSDSSGDPKQEQGPLQSRKSAAASPPNPTRRCQRAQVTEEATSQPRNRQRVQGLAERAEKRAATKSGRSSGDGGPTWAGQRRRVLGIAVVQASGPRIKDSSFVSSRQQSSYPEFPLSPSLSHSFPFISTICERLSKSVRGVSGNFRTVAPSIGRSC